jgi:excisionase family DNA binding protein
MSTDDPTPAESKSHDSCYSTTSPRNSQGHEHRIYALVRNGDLPAIKVGGRGQWRIERSRLEDYIAQAYLDTKHWIRHNPFGNADETDTDDTRGVTK